MRAKSSKVKVLACVHRMNFRTRAQGVREEAKDLIRLSSSVFQTLLPFPNNRPVLGSCARRLPGCRGVEAAAQSPGHRPPPSWDCEPGGRCCTCSQRARPEPAAWKVAACFVPRSPGAQLHFLRGLLPQGPGPGPAALGFAFVSLLCLSDFQSPFALTFNACRKNTLGKQTWERHSSLLSSPSPSSPGFPASSQHFL